MGDSSVIDSSILQSYFRTLRNLSKKRMASSTMFICALLVMTAKAHSADMSAPTVEEARSMPPYCHVKLFEEGTPAAGMWYSNHPDGFSHIHHLCYGLAYLNRSFGAMPKHDKTYLRNAAVGQMDYVISHAKPTFKLLSDVYSYRGQTLQLLNRNAEALDNLKHSLKIDPTQARTYLLLADMLGQSKQKTSALEVVTEGLRYAPQSKGLLRRYKELGGKLPYPEPIQPVLEETAKPAAPVAPEQTPNIGSDAANPVPTTAAPAEPIVQPKIGSDKNPYCRFCPD